MPEQEKKHRPFELGEELAAEASTLDALVHSLDQEVAGVAGVTAMGESEGQATATETDEARYLLFTLADTRYAAKVGHVIEIATIPELTPVPNVPNWVRGVANLRGEILAVLDFRLFLGLEPLGQSDAGRMLVTRTGHDDLTAGLVVDAVNGVTTLRTAELQPPTSPIEDKLSAFLLGVQEHDGRLVAALDLERLLTAPEVRQFEAAA